MPKLTLRLERLEKAISDLGGGVCQLCCGYPVALIHVMHEHDPAGPGYRETGECYLAEMHDNNITDELCCRACGTRATQIQAMCIVGVGPKPEGRRICLPGS
jgi:hypothetical protein